MSTTSARATIPSVSARARNSDASIPLFWRRSSRSLAMGWPMSGATPADVSRMTGPSADARAARSPHSRYGDRHTFPVQTKRIDPRPSLIASGLALRLDRAERGEVGRRRRAAPARPLIGSFGRRPVARGGRLVLAGMQITRLPRWGCRADHAATV